ncbi:COG2423 Predicted ornithine cyclodeaminase, mu-crystallin homolog [Candidatus Nanopelagicaceae bacterium]
MNPKFISAEEISQSFSFLAGVKAIEAALLNGVDPSADLPRSILPIDKGEMLVMPASSAHGSGIKVLTIAPNNPHLNAPRIQGLYLLFDRENLSVSSILDGAALTTYRTPAVSVAAIRQALDLSENDLSIVVFGSGPQAISHIQTFTEVVSSPAQISSVAFIARDIQKAKQQIPDHAKLGLTPDCKVQILGVDSAEVTELLKSADLVIAATTSRTPLFDSTLLKDSVIVIAVGSHEPSVREIDSKLLARAQVVVETRASALREAGDVIMAINEGALQQNMLIDMADVVCRRVKLDRARPILFKSSGMSWEDLVIARAVEQTL